MTAEKKSPKIQDPRQAEFLKLYLTPGTMYFNNALQSGLKAGYTQEYSESILQKDLKWLADGVAEIVGKPTDKKNLVAKAKLVLAKSLDDDDLKLAQDTAKFIAKTDPEFSEKHDVNAAVTVNHYANLTTEELRKLASS